jgi:hypothetical protein
MVGRVWLSLRRTLHSRSTHHVRLVNGPVSAMPITHSAPCQKVIGMAPESVIGMSPESVIGMLRIE